MNEKIIIIGDGEFAEIAYEYFTYDSTYEVAAFAVEKEYLTKDSLFGLPVVELNQVNSLYPPDKYKAYVAITFTKMNRVRTRLYNSMKDKGYTLVSYVSSKAFVWRNAVIGENSFIFEDNTIQYHVNIGNNVVLWSGNHIGHRTKIGDNCFLTSHVVVSGYCNVGDYTFIGVNTTIGDNVNIPKDCVIAAGSTVIKSLPDSGKIYMGSPAKAQEKTVYEHFGIEVAE